MLNRRSAIVYTLVPTLSISNTASALEQCVPGGCSAMLDAQRFEAQQTAQLQRNSQWCWAACISMICGWHGFPISQEAIVDDVYGGLLNMPADDRVLTQSLNRDWKDGDGRPFRISARIFSPNLALNDVSNERVINDLKNDRPLLNGSRTHATVVARVDYSRAASSPQVHRVHVIDPYPGAAPLPYFARLLASDEMTGVHRGGSLRYLASLRVRAA